MLTDEQLDAIGGAVVGAFLTLERWAICDVAKRAVKLKRYADAAKRARDAAMRQGVSRGRAAKVAKRTVTSDAEYRREVQREANGYRREYKARSRTALVTAVERVQQSLLGVVLWVGAEYVTRPRKGGTGKPDVKQPGTQTVERQGERTVVIAYVDEAEKREAEAEAESIATEAAKVVEKELERIGQSMAFRVGGRDTPASRLFQQTVDAALDKFLSGELTIDEALQQTVSELARNGMETVVYTESGRRIVTRTDVAVRRCLQTGAARATGAKIMADCKRLGVNHVEVSAHWGARTDGSGGHADHQAWQGKVYQIDGSSDEYPNLEQATGYPGDMLGLFGYNCRHSMSLFYPGISTPNAWQTEPAPKRYGGKEYAYYEATQRMRRYEREIRAAKREGYATEALGESVVPQSRIEALKDEYKAFCKAMGIRPAWNRTLVTDEKPDFKRIFAR